MSNNKKATGSFVYASTITDFEAPPETKLAPHVEDSMQATEYPAINEALGNTEQQEPTVDNSHYLAIYKEATGQAAPEKCHSCPAFAICGLEDIMARLLG